MIKTSNILKFEKKIQLLHRKELNIINNYIHQINKVDIYFLVLSLEGFGQDILND